MPEEGRRCLGVLEDRENGRYELRACANMGIRLGLRSWGSQLEKQEISGKGCIYFSRDMSMMISTAVTGHGREDGYISKEGRQGIAQVDGQDTLKELDLIQKFTKDSKDCS